MVKRRLKLFVQVATMLSTVAILGAGASADEGYLFDQRSSSVIVWKSELAMKEGVVLLEAKQIDLAAQYAACVVEQHTKVVFLPGGYESIPVMIIDGPHRGCRGNVESGVAYNKK